MSSARFLPTTREELHARGWSELDVLIVSGDAYVDHPAFGTALIARSLEARGLRVGIVPQPRWDAIDDVARMGRPRLFVGISAGNLDSMLNKLTAQKKVRSTDDYSPGGRTGMRPNRATVVYSNLCRQAFPGLPIVLGGIEASLRRVAHYDYWSDSVRRSVLLDAKAHLLAYGMAERAVGEIAERLARGEPLSALLDIRGTARIVASPSEWQPLAERESRRVGEPGNVVLPSYDDVRTDASAFARMSRMLELESNPLNGRPMLQAHGIEAIWLNPPAMRLGEDEMDALYGLPFAYAPHVTYREPIPAFETIRRSVVMHRGCFGGCSFCSITQHEGRMIQNRSEPSVLRDVKRLGSGGAGSGVVSDLGGPTANMYRMGCCDPNIERACRKPSCVHPRICANLTTDHRPLVELMRKARRVPGIRHVHVASGIRYDLALLSPQYIAELAQHHTGGQLSVAPEHVDRRVLAKMRKPGVEAFEKFVDVFEKASRAAGKEQYLIPYLIIAHPGSTLHDTIELALYLKRRGLRPRQVQEFIPTPMTMATAMYHSGLDPVTGEAVPVVRDLREKRMMKALVMWWDEAQWPLAREALSKASRRELIGSGERCLIPANRPGDCLRSGNAVKRIRR